MKVDDVEAWEQRAILIARDLDKAVNKLNDLIEDIRQTSESKEGRQTDERP